MPVPLESLEAQSELAGLLFTTGSFGSLLEHVASIAVRAVPACDMAGVSLLDNDRVTTAAATEDLVSRIDEHQYAANEGPCVEALRTGELRRSAWLATETRWPAFRPRAMADGVVGCLSIPLVAGGGRAHL